jgi:hypothetical protein
MAWTLPDEPWQYRLLDSLPSSLDEGQLMENLKLTPTQRMEKLQAMVDFAAELERSRVKSGG